MSSLAVLSLLALAAFTRGTAAADTCPSGHTLINSDAYGNAVTPECCYTGFETTGDFKCVKANFGSVYQVACSTQTSGTFTATAGAEFTQFAAYLSTSGTPDVAFRQSIFKYIGDQPLSQSYSLKASVPDLTISDANCVTGDCRWLIMSEQDGQKNGEVLYGPFDVQNVQGPLMDYPAKAGFYALSEYDFPCIEIIEEPEPEPVEDDEPVVNDPEPIGDDDEPVPVIEAPGGDKEEEEPVTETTYSSTQVAFQTVYVSTLKTPSATITSTPTSTVYTTPATSTVTEHETSEIDLGPEYYTDYVEVDVTTPAPVTVQTSTDVTNTPAEATITATVTPATSTVYETKWATSTPPTKTVQAVQTVYTGHADCTNFRLTFPAECCPSDYVKLRTLQRRAVEFDLEKRAGSTVLVDGGVFTSTSTLYETRTVAEGEATVTAEPATKTEAAAVPLTTTTETETVTLPRAQILTVISTTGEAETPYFTVTSTNYHQAPTPTKNVQVMAETPVSTITVQSTTTLAEQTTTTTSTAYAQATTCASKNVYSQDRCPSSNFGKNLVQDAQVAALKLYKSLGGKRVVVDCGSAGVFTY